MTESVPCYPEVVEGDLVRVGVGGGQRFEEGSVISSGLQQLTQLLQHGRSVGRHRRVSRHFRRRDAHELREELLSLRMLLKQTEQRENLRQASADHIHVNQAYVGN